MWELGEENGVQVLGCDGFEISVDELLKAPGFFVTHVAEKGWGTQHVVSELVDQIVMLTQQRTAASVRSAA